MTTVRKVEVGEFTEEQLRVSRAGEALHRDGASPAGALELLAAIIEDRTWERVADARGRSFDGRFREFVQTRVPFGLGFDVDQLPKVIGLRHPHESTPRVAERMAHMRAEVASLLLESRSAALPIGRPDCQQREMNVSRSFLPAGRPDTAGKVVARLKRDDPVLAERVVRGEISPNAAAYEKGWRKPRILLTSPERVAEAIRRYMPAESITRLARLLMAADEGEPHEPGAD